MCESTRRKALCVRCIMICSHQLTLRSPRIWNSINFGVYIQVLYRFYYRATWIIELRNKSFRILPLTKINTSTHNLSSDKLSQIFNMFRGNQDELDTSKNWIKSSGDWVLKQKLCSIFLWVAISKTSFSIRPFTTYLLFLNLKIKKCVIWTQR